ncbi:MAG: SDR family NAD(P)-dependent oxidoreductase [Hyphomicrobiaceae bacterium]
MDLIDLWKRRAWRRDDAAIAALSGTRPAVVVTGGSDGIGRALAEAFGTQERTVVLVARGVPQLTKTQAHLASTGHNDVLTLSVDIAEAAAPAAIRQFLTDHNLFADILINSAGIASTGDFADEPAENLAAQTELNVTALTRLCRAFLPDMLIRGRGGILNVASLGGFAPGPYQAAYYASKAYVISLTRALGHETRGQGVRMACLAPGPVNTEFHARARGQTALYRRIIPAMAPEQIARSARRGYDLGMGMIVPGVISNVLGFALRVLPAKLTTPIVAILLKPRPPATSSQQSVVSTPNARPNDKSTS